MIELIATVTILAVLVGMVVPLARFTVKREKERELRRDLWDMRDAIDRYQQFLQSKPNMTRTKLGSEGYPPDLETLVKGVDVQGQKTRFLRRIPIDPMTGKAEWTLHSMQDDRDSDSWDGQYVFDVRSKSQGIALDGTKYKDW